jgi:hypothetical protein
MPKKPLTHRAFEVYASDGILRLLFETGSYVKNSILSAYRGTVERLKRPLPGKEKQITLNDVPVIVKTHWIDAYIPYYESPYPTESDPHYEYTEVEGLRTYTESNDDVVIIGGGLGVTTVVASNLTDGTVTTYEPSEYVYQLLQETIELNNCCDNVTEICAAICTVKDSNLAHTRPSNMETLPLSELPDADVYEMDCEGAETFILEQVKVRPSVILVETHANEGEVVELLEKAGYEIQEIVSGEKGQHPACSHVRAIYSTDSN